MRLLAVAFIGLLPLLVLSANLGHTSTVSNVRAQHAPRGHGWNVRWHGPTQHLRVLRAIERHDGWVVGNAKRFHFPRRTVSFHKRELHHAHVKIRHAEAKLHPTSVRDIICSVFTGSLCSQALAIVNCETGGTFNPRIIGGGGNGYYGLFQFGAYARSAYGFGWDAWTQTRAAKRYYDAAGWHPWECAYIVGIL